MAGSDPLLPDGMVGDDFFAVAESSPDYVALAWLDNRVAYVNPAGRRLVGLASLEEARSHPIADYLTEEGLRASVEIEQPAVVEHGYWQGRSSLRHFQTGAAIPVEITSFLVTDPRTGEPRLLATFQRDISAQIALEQRLSQAERMQTIGQMAGGIAHDFNNILSVVMGTAAFALLDEEDPAKRELLTSIATAGERGAQITRQLLGLARRDVVQPTLVDPNELMAEVLPMVQRLAGDRIECTLRQTPGVGGVWADRTQLTQIILNLAANARDAMPRGGRLELSTDLVGPADESEREPEVALRVTDTGSGIDPEHLPRVTEPFFTTKSRGEGTGLGLATVVGVAGELGGRVDIDSSPGGGTRVEVVLPRATIAVSSTAEPTPADQAGLGGSETVLLVEDDADVLPMLQRVLEVHGYQVRTATRGSEAMAALEANGAIDLVVTDMVMPDASGRQVAERVRELRPATPVLVISGYVDREDFRSALSHGQYEFLPKPFLPTVFVRRVRALLDQAASR